MNNGIGEREEDGIFGGRYDSGLMGCELFDLRQASSIEVKNTVTKLRTFQALKKLNTTAEKRAIQI